MKLDTLDGWERTHLSTEIGEKDVDTQVLVMGWILRRRDHGGVIFVDLRDRRGLVQIVFNPQHSEETHRKAHELRPEWVVAAKGTVRLRPEDSVNPNLPTGKIEVFVDELKILNASDSPPFPLDEDEPPNDAIRYRYRYLDLRRPGGARKGIFARHRFNSLVRGFLNQEDFVEIETPFLTTSTPEGQGTTRARAAFRREAFTRLPQSPQIFKQLLMVAGFERYYQIVRCFRDEDLRADRQPEFTQLDMETSFMDEDQLFDIMERMMTLIFGDIRGMRLNTPFPQLTYAEAMGRFGVDKPDIRFGMELADISEIVAGTEFGVFRSALKSGGIVKAMKVQDGDRLSRKELDDLRDFAAIYGGKG